MGMRRMWRARDGENSLTARGMGYAYAFLSAHISQPMWTICVSIWALDKRAKDRERERERETDREHHSKRAWASEGVTESFYLHLGFLSCIGSSSLSVWPTTWDKVRSRPTGKIKARARSWPAVAGTNSRSTIYTKFVVRAQAAPSSELKSSRWLGHDPKTEPRAGPGIIRGSLNKQENG